MNKLTTVKGISKKLVTKQKIQRAEVQGLWNIHTRILDLSNPESFFSFQFGFSNFRSRIRVTSFFDLLIPFHPGLRFVCIQSLHLSL